MRSLSRKQVAATAACEFESHRFRLRSAWAHRPTGRRRLRTPKIRVQLSVSPLVGGLRLEATGFRFGAWHAVLLMPQVSHLFQSRGLVAKAALLQSDDRWFESTRDYSPRYANLVERLGLNPSVCGFDSHLGHCDKRLGRQSADHSRLEREMLWVRLPPELLARNSVLVEQPGVLACLSSRRSWVQIPSGTLAARYANWQSSEAQTFVTAGSNPACATGRGVRLAT